MWFIMMYNQSGNKIMPMVSENDEIAIFETETDALNCANNHMVCSAFGYEIFEM